MPKLFKSILVKRFLAHLLEIGTTFSITLILLNILLWFFGVAGIPNILSEQKGILISISNESLSYEGSIFNSLLFTISRVNVIFNFFSNLLVQDETFGNLLKISFNLFLIFVLPALILSVIYLKISKGKQLFWDYYSGITLK